MVSKFVLVCALLGLASGDSLRDKRGILDLAENALNLFFGNDAGVIGDQKSIEEQCNALGYFKREGRYMEKRGFLNLANKAISGGLAGIGSVIGFSIDQDACEANGYVKDAAAPQNGDGDGGSQVFIQGNSTPSRIIISDPQTL